MKTKSILILGVHRSGTHSLAINLRKQIGKSIMEPWSNNTNKDSYIFSNITYKYNTVVKSMVNHKPYNYKKDHFSFLVKLVEYFGKDNTILISRKNFDNHLLSFFNLMYGEYDFKQHFLKTGEKNYQLKKNNQRRWKVSDLPQSFITDQSLQEKYSTILTERIQLISKLSSYLKKKIVWYEELYGNDRNLSLDIIKSWKFDIDCNLLNENLNPKYKYKKNEEFRLL